MVKRESPFAYSGLSNWELISAFSYCKKTRERETLQFKREFHTLCHFFFDGDVKGAEQALDEIMAFYTQEFSKRNSN